MFTTFSFGINPTQIAQYLDYALYGIFGLVVLGFIFGFIRGVWREGFRLLFVGGLVVISILFTRQLVELFMDTDVSSIAASAGYSSITLTLNSIPVIVSVTTPYDTVYNLLEQSLLAFGFFITPAIADLVIGLTLVILRYLLFIVLAIVIFLLGEFIAAFLYFIPFRFLIPLHLRKKVKLRLLGGAAGALKVTLILTMFLSPFTSLVNTVTTSFKDFDEQYGEQIDAELYNEIMAFVDTYNDSTLAQTLFSWSISDNGLSFDSALMDFVSGQDLDDYRLTLANELGSVVDIAATLIGSGAIDATFSTIDTSLLLTEDLVTNLITSLTGSVLIMKILPIAITIGLNLDEVSNYLDPSLVVLDNLVWENELNYIGDIFKGVIRSGLLSPILNGNTDLSFIINELFSPTAAPEVNQILSILDESPFLSQVIPAVLFKLVEDEIAAGGPEGGVGLSNFLPTDWADYQDIQFGSELSLIYNLVYELNAEVGGFLDLVVPSNQSSIPLGRKQVNGSSSPTIVDLLRDHFDLFVEVLIGEVNNVGQPINNNPITGKAINRRSLLDSDLIVNGLPSIVENLLLPSLTSVAGENFDDTDLNELVSSFNSGTQGAVRLNYKGEFAGILSILDAVIANDTLVSLIQPEPGQSLDILALLEDGEFRKGLKSDLIPTLDRSQIILTVVPGILESTLTGEGFDDFLSLISLTTEDLNFEFTSLSRELIIVIDMMGYAFNVIEVSDDLLNQFPTIAYDLVGLLDNIYLSDIINKNPITNNKTTNYNLIIKGIFSLVDGIEIDEADIDVGFNRVGPVGQQNGWTTTFIDTNQNDKLDDFDTISFAGENYHLINFLKNAIDSGLLDISGDIFEALNDLTSGSEDLDDPNVSILYKVFAFADRSEIISASFGGILDNLFGSTGGLLDSELGSSFRNVTSWTEEGSNLLFLVKRAANFSNGLENIDFLNSDVTLIEELLQGLAASQIFVKSNGDYVFPDFLLNQLTGISSLASYFIDPTPFQSSFDDDPTDPYTIVTEDFYQISNQAATKTNWYGVKSLVVDAQADPILNEEGDLQYEYIGGELENIVGFIAELQSISIDDFTSGTEIDGDTTRDVLLALNEATSLRVLIYNIFDSIFGGTNLDIGSVSFSDTNTFVFLELNQANRALQIEATADLLDITADMGLDGGGSFDIANFDETTILSIGDLLTTLHGSRLFNSFKIGNSRASNDLTVFEQTYRFLLTTATLDTFIYDDGFTELQREQALYQDLVSLNNNFGVNNDDDWNGVDGEIQKFVDVMVAYVNTEIDFADFGGDAIGDLLNTEPGLDKVEDLLLAINESVIISPAIGQLFGNVFESDSFNIEGLTMNEANTQYFSNEPVTEKRAQEISLILDIYQDISTIGLSSGGALTKDNLDPVKFETLLLNMYASNVFNTFQVNKSYLLNHLTIFEQTIRMILNSSTIDTFIYDGETQTSRLNLLRIDIAQQVNSFGNALLTNDWLGETGEIKKIINILDAFTNLDIVDFTAFSGAGSSDVFSDLTETDEGLASIENLLFTMNDSQLVYPSVPNLFSNMLNASSIGTLDVDFSLANTRYRGNRIDPLNPQTGDRYLPYQEEEISGLLTIFKTVKEVGTREYNNLNLIDNDALDEMQSLLEDIYQSNVFHLQGPSTALITDLTVFEQMVVMMMNQTRVSDLIYDTNNPNPNYTGQFSSKETKARFLVLNFETLFPVNNLTHFTSRWLNHENTEGELTKFFRVFKELKLNLPGVGNLDGIDVGNISPNAISRILAALNYSSLSSDAVPDLVKDAFGFISFSTYTEGNENYYLTPRQYEMTDLNQMDYSTNTPTISQLGVIPQVLNNFYDSTTNAYLDLGTNFSMKDYLDDGNSTFAILDLLSRSRLFGNDALTIDSPSLAQPGIRPVSLSFKTRALAFFNLLDGSSVTKYFSYLNTNLDEKEKKVVRIEQIFSGDFDTPFEAERLDQFISVLTQFTELEDASDISENPSEMRSLIELTYSATGYTITDRAYLVSELSAGFFTDIFNEEYAKVTDTNAPFFGDVSNLNKRINFYDGNPNNLIDNDFLSLNPYEADGIEGALIYLNIISGISDDYIFSNFDPNFNPGASRITSMKNSLTLMGSLLNNQTIGTAPFGPTHDLSAYDYTDWTVLGNSQIAKLFYASQVVQAPGFTFFGQLVEAKSFVMNPFFIVTLANSSYQTNFVFEIEGEKLEYIFA